MNDDELQALLDSGDPDNIDKALKYLDENKEDVTAEPSSGSQGAEQDAANKGNDVKPGSSPTEEAAPKGIASKNGEHVLPFEVLEQERREKQDLQRRLQESERQLQDSQTLAEKAAAMTQQVELLQNQLSKHGIKPAQLAKDLQLTEAELENLDEYGEIGEVSAKTARKLMELEKLIASLSGQQQTAAPAAAKAADADPGVNEVHAAIEATDGMRAVMSDPTLSKHAVAIDEQLKAEPAFANKPLEARFAEVMKRMAPVILKATANGKKQQDDDFDEVKPPHSLSGIAGATNDVNAPLSQQLEGLGEAELQHRFMQMTDAQQQQVMRELGHL